MPRHSRNDGATEVAARLRARHEEIEAAIFARLSAVFEPPTNGDPEYVEGLREAITAGIAFSIEGVERGDQAAGPVPSVVLGQARLAAAMGVGLDIVLRRYWAAHVLLGDFLVEESERDHGTSPGELKALLRRLAAAVDRLLSAATEAHHAYSEEEARRRRGSERRRIELIERLLAGEPLDTHELGYDIRGRQMGLCASGAGVGEALRVLARHLDAGLLLAEREDGTLWAWLGRRGSLEVDIARRYLVARSPPGARVAFGEMGEGPAGWRLTHCQARAAFAVARRGQEPIVRYTDVALLAAVMQDDLLAISLRQLYLEPLEDGGAGLRETLRAYLAAGRNGASAAKALGVSRQTVNQRLQTAEERIGRSLLTSGSELDAALRLAELDGLGLDSAQA